MIAAFREWARRRRFWRELHRKGWHSAACPRSCGYGNNIRSFNTSRREVDRLHQRDEVT